MKPVLFFFVLVLQAVVAHAEEGDFGVEVDVVTFGLFPPKLESVVVATVKPGSSADDAGIKVGDTIVSIEGCKIPGCSAFKAQKLMKKERGESAAFEVLGESGESRPVTLTAR